MRTVIKPLNAVQGADWYLVMLEGSTLPASIAASETIVSASARLLDLTSGAQLPLTPCTVDAGTNALFTIAGQTAGHAYWLIVTFDNGAGKVWTAQAYVECPPIPPLAP